MLRPVPAPAPCLQGAELHRRRAASLRRLRRTASASGLDAVTFSLIVDDIVHPDGRTTMAALGGGGAQTAFGLRLHPSCLSVGLAATVGADMPERCLDVLRANGVDTRGLLRTDEATPRAWQVCEADGRRTQLPVEYRSPRCFHIGVHPIEADIAHLEELADAAPLSVEPYTAADRPLSRHELRRLCARASIFSPNEAEAASMLGAALPPLQAARAFVEAGAGIAVLRMAERGALAASSAEAWLVPALPGVRVVDATGCGNAFCGAFLASFLAGEGLCEAACWGNVAASFLLEAEGMPAGGVSAALRDEAARRVARLRPLAQRVASGASGKCDPQDNSTPH